MEGIPYAVRLAAGIRRPKNPVRGLELAGVVRGLVQELRRGGARVLGERSLADAEDLVAGLEFGDLRAHLAVPVSATTALVGLRAAKPREGGDHGLLIWGQRRAPSE